MLVCKYLNPHCRSMLSCCDVGLGEKPNPWLTLASPGGQHRAATAAGNAPLYSGTPHPSTWAQSVRENKMQDFESIVLK